MISRLSLLVVIAVLLAPMSARAGAGDALGIVGGWSVVSTFSSSSCAKPNDTGGTDAYSWLVSADANGLYDVAVQGTTGYPHLAGTSEAGALRLVGLQRDGKVTASDVLATAAGDLLNDGTVLYRLGRADFILSLKDGMLVGTRSVMLVEGVFSTVTGATPNVFTGCRVEYSVVGKRL